MRVLAIVSILMSLLLTGCSTTGDPRTGGLFGYSPSSYEARQQEREARLSQIEAQQASAWSDFYDYTAEYDAVSALVKQQRQQLAALQVASQTLAVSLNNARAGNQEQQTRLAQLKNRQAAVDSQLSNLAQAPDSTEKQALLEELRQELRLLEQEAAILSGL